MFKFLSVNFYLQKKNLTYLFVYCEFFETLNHHNFLNYSKSFSTLINFSIKA